MLDQHAAKEKVMPASFLQFEQNSPLRNLVSVAAFREDKMPQPRLLHCETQRATCQSRCCKLRILLTEDEVRSGQYEWNSCDPFALSRRTDGYCFYFDAKTNGCGIYDNRPLVCKVYSCMPHCEFPLSQPGHCSKGIAITNTTKET
jgi:Putative zinc- or iron-chelating domain